MHEQVNYDLANSAMPAFNFILFLKKNHMNLYPKAANRLQLEKT